MTVNPYSKEHQNIILMLIHKEAISFKDNSVLIRNENFGQLRILILWSSNIMRIVADDKN